MLQFVTENNCVIKMELCYNEDLLCVKAYYDTSSSALARWIVMSLVTSWPLTISIMNGTRTKAIGTAARKTMA